MPAPDETSHMAEAIDVLTARITTLEQTVAHHEIVLKRLLDILLKQITTSDTIRAASILRHLDDLEQGG